jgi:hypothetical protein
MFSRCIAWWYRRVICRISTVPDTGWFMSTYTQAQVHEMLALLKFFLQQADVASDVVGEDLVAQMATLIFHQDAFSYAKLEPCCSWQAGFASLNQQQRLDILPLMLILCFSSTAFLSKRLLVLSKVLAFVPCSVKLRRVVSALVQGKTKRLSRPWVLGEGVHNQLARLQGMRCLGWRAYRLQMRMMGGEITLPKLKKKYAFIKHLASSTLGGGLYAMWQRAALSLPGEKHGFAECFLWHDLAHLLSGNGTDFPGELATNAFTAGFSRYGKLEILIWGLLQFNLGYSLAVVAKPGKDYLQDAKLRHLYVRSLQVGLSSKLDLLHWPSEQISFACHQSLDCVRATHHIKVPEDSGLCV